MLRFNDGMTFDTDGEYRVVYRKDGYYVTGHGLLCPVDSHSEGEELIKDLEGRDEHTT